jgi:hypothetical protein
MRLALRYPIAFVAVLLACGALAAELTVFKPAYHRPAESKMIDFSQQRYYSPVLVQRTFAQHGVPLRLTSRFSGITMFSRAPVPQASALQVLVAPHTGTGSWGPELEPYDERFGNVFVTYGGRDRTLLARVKAAVASLRSS